MSNFSFPPPPPPPPPPAPNAAPPPPPAQRGGNNSRVRGRGRGGNHRGGGVNAGGHQQHHAPYRTPNQTPRSAGNHPLPNYPAWSQSSAQQFPPSYHTAQPLNTNSYPQYNASQPQYHIAQPVQPSYYGQVQQPGTPYQSQNVASNSMMAPPVRMGVNMPNGHTNNRGQSSTFAGHKRKRDHPGNSSQNMSPPNAQPTSKLPAPPAVPTFGFSLPPKPPPVESTFKKSKNKKRRKHNQLGLTPQGEVHEDSDQEVDEEALFAQSGQPVQIQHRGQSIQLNSAADLAAWIAERKKRFPTQAKVAERKAAQEIERKRRQEEKEKWQAKKKEERQKRDADRDADRKQKKNKGRPDGRPRSASMQSSTTVKPTIEHGSGNSPTTEVKQESQSGSVMPEDPLARIAFLEEQLRLAKVAAARASETASVEPTAVKQEIVQPLSTIKENDDAAQGASPVLLSAAVSDGDTVTTEAPKVDLGLAYSTEDSGSMDESASDISSEDPSSDSDSDAPPDEETAKSGELLEVQPPPREKLKAICKHFAKYGNCKFGKNCRLSHDVVPSTGKGGATMRSGGEKKKLLSLRERLIEQELKEEAKLGVQIVKYLAQNKII